MTPRAPKRQRRAWSVSVYCRHQGSVLLVLHNRLKTWLPIGGEIEPGETPLEAARRELREETGYDKDVVFPAIHKVIGAPPGLILYGEHPAGSKGLHLNFAFLAEVPSKQARTCNEYSGMMWVKAIPDVPENCPPNVRETLRYALTAGREGLILAV